MSSASPTRTSRRTAGRRRVVVDDDDGSDVENTMATRAKDDDSEQDFDPAQKASRASPRRKTVGDATPKRRTTTTRRTRVTESVEPSIEPSQVFSPPESVADEPLSPSKRSPPKRRSVKDARAARKSRASRLSIAADCPPAQTEPLLPTPQATVSPEPMSRSGTPLTDITESAINEQTPKPSSRPSVPPGEELDTTTMEATPPHQVPATNIHAEDAEDATEVGQTRIQVRKVDPNITKLDRPMDIMVRKRALGVPQSHQLAEPKARMTITYLILTNFKSYAGRQEVGPFHASFSSVVGPNGSGKSNVIDSLLFVFGFRASKMRQGKISALIHNSAQHPDLEFCEVEVHFQEVMDQPGGESVVLPNSQLVVSRRAFKNNSSKYYINGKTSDFTTVTTLLKDRGIDLDHKRFLILQGEVESIAQMKPKAANENDDGLLEYLEDIIGTSKYKAPINEAATETEALNEVCLEKSNRVQHVEKEKNGLEDKKEKALNYIRNENELTSKQSALYQIYVAECGDNILVTEEAIADIQGQLDDELGRYKEAEDEIKALEDQYKAGTKQCNRLEKETAGLSKKVEELDKTGIKVEEKKKHLNNKANKLRKTVDSSQFSVDQSKTLVTQAEQDIQRLSAEIESLEQQLQAEDEDLAVIRENLRGKTQGLSDEIAIKQKQLEPWNARINEKRSAVAVARSELDILRERESAGATAMAEIDERIAGLKEARKAKEVEIEACKTERKVAERQAQSAQKQLADVTATEPALKSKLSNARQRADEARASLSATQSQGNVLAALTRLKESGRIDGLAGRLGNLGAIDAKYDVAISTAAPALEHMVVDTVECAQQCIEYLRKNGLGRASFICLDKLAQRNMSPIQTPENCARLFDLVRSKHERFLPAFYHVLQNTLVANDSEQADRVAYGAKRWRVVSLEGKLIDISGVMSGGGHRVAKGAMSAKVTSDMTKEQVAKYEVDRDALESQHAELQEQIQRLESQVKDLSMQLPKLETRSQKLGLELDSIDRNIEDAQKRMRELESARQPTKSDKNKLASLEDSILTMQHEAEKLQAQTQGIEDDIQQLQDKIMETGGVKLRSQKAKVDGLKEQITSLTETRDNAEVSKAKGEKQRSKHEKAHVDAHAELAKIDADVEKLEEEVQSQNDNTSGLRKQAEDAKMELEEKQDALREVKKQLDECVAELNNTRGAEVDMRNKLEENHKHLVDNQKRQRHWQEKLSKLTLQNVSEDGEERDGEPVPELSRDELEDLDKDELKAAIAVLEDRTSQHVELSVLAEYRRRANEYTSRVEDLNSALALRDSAKKRTDELRRLRLEGFMEGFSTISLRLKEMYQMITMGGNAELELVDSLDPFSEGILFSVMPPKKSWKNIGNLSGGEKTLSSLALVFALHHYKPTPLYVMDEIDAALDFRNVSIVAAYIKERTKNAQFIVISLRNNMFELASRLVGVYKVNHMTKSVTVENRDYIVPRAQA